MDILQIIILALVQGLTEFLPISSSAHLILVPYITDWPDQGLAFDVAVHVGTLTAVVLYFRKEIKVMFFAWIDSLKGKHSEDSKLAWAVLVGTIPVGLAGLLFKDIISDHLRTPLVIAATTIIFGLLLGYSHCSGKRQRDEHSLTWKDIIVIGCAQAIALIPGTSRSGITITAGLLMGLTAQAAARFSFLLSIPVIVLAGGVETMDYLAVASIDDMNDLIIGALISAVSAFLCIHYFLILLDRIGMTPFVIYRLLLGIILLLLYA
ncbi:MAG: undecaprenyl-diphosphate phosphatase [Gammaproteobacteria bacterium]|nr:undecaprenyl-diphosphate phosphatase [Gammaproteobacteria bacterium]NNJ49934.1 undecaprenyl-diphosphate phosphatase [Gammaproteobacteria bacterium]